MSKTAKAKVASLLPNAKTYIENGQNILLIGLHGTGKTETIRALAEEMGLKVKSYSCSTLDPFTDLVGVPVPRIGEDGREHLKMIRPIDIDEANIVFFDELNRARPEVQDAVLEIIQSKTINGEPLPNLMCCIGAINPPNGEYKVEELDPALMDRFDGYIEFTPRPSVAYMAQHMDKAVAQALKSWWDDHNREKRGPESYISPRRLYKIGMVFTTHKNKRAVLQSLPPGGKYDSNKLYTMLDEALHPEKKAKREAANIGDGAASGIDFTDVKTMAKDKDKLAVFLRSNPQALETHRKTSKALENGVSGQVLISEWDEVLDGLHKPVLEALINSFAQPKVSQMRLAFTERLEKDKKWARSRRNLYDALQATAKNALSQMPAMP